MFSDLPFLKELMLSNIGLRRISRSINKLKALDTLDLSHNQLSSIPEELYEIKTLKYLNLSINKLKKISCKIIDLVKLYHLDLIINKLEDFPELDNENLKILDLSENTFNAEIKIKLTEYYTRGDLEFDI